MASWYRTLRIPNYPTRYEQECAEYDDASAPRRAPDGGYVCYEVTIPLGTGQFSGEWYRVESE